MAVLWAVPARSSRAPELRPERCGCRRPDPRVQTNPRAAEVRKNPSATPSNEPEGSGSPNEPERHAIQTNPVWQSCGREVGRTTRARTGGVGDWKGRGPEPVARHTIRPRGSCEADEPEADATVKTDARSLCPPVSENPLEIGSEPAYAVAMGGALQGHPSRVAMGDRRRPDLPFLEKSSPIAIYGATPNLRMSLRLPADHL